ncbi:MAG TPA: hypothetical protein VJ570_14390 [Holophagaceae bacterium]|nr:hypothetical protein [Holophagaceae bacterium]
MSRCALVLVLACLFPPPLAAQSVGGPPAAVPARAAGTVLPVDRGWLGAEGSVEFRAVPELEWLVVAPGAAQGSSIRIGPWTSAPLPPTRSAVERSFTEGCGVSFQRHMKETLKNARYRLGEVVWSGRVIDVSEADRMVLVDFKGTDATTGRFLWAFRRRLQPDDRKAFVATAFEDAFKSLGKLVKKGLLGGYPTGTRIEVPFIEGEPPSQAQPPSAVAASPLLDEGLLDPRWFRPEGSIPFRRSKEIDYLWVKPGFDLRGKRVRVAPWGIAPLPANRDEKDEDKARELTEEMPGNVLSVFARELGDGVKVSELEGEFRLDGRWVDQRDSNSMAFIHAREVFDLRVVEVSTGELVVAAHHACEFYAPSLALKRWLKEFCAYTKEGLSPSYDRASSAAIP